MATSFVKRKIDIAIKLTSAAKNNQPAVFASSGTDSVTLSGTRTSVRIQNSGGQAGSEAQVSIWGLPPAVMNQLDTLGMAIQIIPQNVMTITAGDEVSGMSAVFVGTIMQSYGDYNHQPDVPMRFECRAGGAEQVIPFPASSYTGATDVATILSAIARKNNWGFENSGVTGVVLSNPYLSGSSIEQVRTVAQAARINASLINNVLCIWPRNGARTATGGIPLISPASGMIGYPSFTPQGILVKTIFDPRITFGSQVKVDSSILTAQSLERINSESSVWNVSKLDLALDAEMPSGQWMSTLYAYNPRGAQPLPPNTGGR